MKLFFCVFFLLASCGLGIIREYTYHTSAITWDQAQIYCRRNYRDLATITTPEERKRLVNIGNRNISVWIGLYRTDVVKNTWQWSDGEPFSFGPSIGPGDSTYNCGAVNKESWLNDKCAWNHPFYCYRFLILVNESKTWDEALQYCRTHYTGLAALPNATQLQQAKPELALTQTVSVWTGLHFIDGKWFWLNGESLGTQPGTVQLPATPVSLPPCPAQPYRCGAFNNNTNVWENQDCNEKLNFLCWR